MNATKKKLAALGVAAAAMTSALAGPAALAQSNRQKDKNNLRNLGIGLGAIAAQQALKGKGTNALILGAGAAYSAKKYEDARKAQRKEGRRRYYRRDVSSAASERPIDVLLNEKPVAFTDARPRMMQGQVYVPLRGVLEKMGANVHWDDADRAAVATYNSTNVVLPVRGRATVNGDPVSLEAPARLADGHTYVPLRFLAETFGSTVSWDPEERRVRIEDESAAARRSADNR